MKINWDVWVGSTYDKATMFIKRLLWIPVWRRNGKWLGCRIDLHKFVGVDNPGCFHTHPAHAFRWVLWGGYEEEVYFGEFQGREVTHVLPCYAWTLDWIYPKFAHRVHRLLNGKVSYSLWFRGPVIAKIELLGKGWPAGTKAYQEGGDQDIS